jgi:hypothetical protein
LTILPIIPEKKPDQDQTKQDWQDDTGIDEGVYCAGHYDHSSLLAMLTL